MKTQTIIRTVLPTLVLALVPACKKTRFGVGCEKAAALTSPWTELSLPIDEDKTRVCESSAESAKLRSYTWTTASAAHEAFKTTLLAAGYVEDRCSGPACYYDKDGWQVAVQPATFKVKKKDLVTIALRRRQDSTQKKKE